MGAGLPFKSLDGIKTVSVETDGQHILRVVGPFYLLDERGHQMLPLDAALSTEPGATSTSCGVVSSLVAIEVLVPVAPTLRFPLV